MGCLHVDIAIMAAHPVNTLYSSSPSLSGARVNDWMRAIRTPLQYRVGTSIVHIKTIMLAKLSGALLVFMTVCVLVTPAAKYSAKVDKRYSLFPSYNATYPLTEHVITSDGSLRFRIAIVADMDRESKSKTEENTWNSYLKKGYLTLSEDRSKVTVKWDSGQITLKTTLSEKGRGAELSELVVYNGKLYTVDDRTGIVYEITEDNELLQWNILQDGNGRVKKGFKGEWMTVKDRVLWVGGIGKEWTTRQGEVLHLNPQFVKSIGSHGDVLHHDWHEHYNAMKVKGGFPSPGYVIHEAVVWSDVHKRWYFLPRRASTEKYDDVQDEYRGTNVLFSANKHFKDISVSKLGPLSRTHGFSSFKFIPCTSDSLLVALKSEEVKDKTVSYIMAFNLNGDILLPETKIADFKFEGIEFI